jgi:hypothetical protein
MLTKMVNGETVVLSAQEEAEIRSKWAQADVEAAKEKSKEHITKRLIEYPPVQDQLLMIWDSMDKGEIPQSKAFYNAIKAINDKHPAP